MSNLTSSLRSHLKSPEAWSQPELFDLHNTTDQNEVERRLNDGDIKEVVDPVNDMMNELAELRHPELADNYDEKRDFRHDVLGDELSGDWFYFKWDHSLNHFPGKDIHQELRTARNHDMLTREEQQKLLGSRIAVLGLSVGSQVARRLVQGGIGGSIALGDSDVIEATNLNRIDGGNANLGQSKLDKVAIEISRMDPYIEQTHFRHGITAENMSELEQYRPDLIFDEIDDLSVKALLRETSIRRSIPLVMATDAGDKSVIDVERHDQNGLLPPFNGRVSSELSSRLADDVANDVDERRAVLQLIGINNISARLLRAAVREDGSMGHIPQLGSTSAACGVYSTIAAREILLNRTMKSGRYIVSPKRIFKLKNPDSIAESLRVYGRLVRSVSKS